MPRITARTDELQVLFDLAPGRYVVVGQRWNGEVMAPALHDPCGPAAELWLPETEEPTILVHEGVDILSLPIGFDRLGGTGRTILIGDETIVAHGRILIMPCVSDRPATHYPYASVRESLPFDVEADGVITVAHDTGDIGFYRCGVLDGVDTSRPSVFTIDGVVIDMADEDAFQAFDYGSEEFNAKLDEHGFFADLRPARRRLQAMGETGADMLATLGTISDHVYAYYRQV